MVLRLPMRAAVSTPKATRRSRLQSHSLHSFSAYPRDIPVSTNSVYAYAVLSVNGSVYFGGQSRPWAIDLFD